MRDQREKAEISHEARRVRVEILPGRRVEIDRIVEARRLFRAGIVDAKEHFASRLAREAA